MTNYIVKTTTGMVPIDEDELEKVVECIRKRTVAICRQGIVVGAFVADVTEDHWRKKGYNYGYDVVKELRPAPPDVPLPDKFATLRAKLNGDVKQIETHG